jgi:Na+-transporting NADH:ubiquinone oxidoreductase subunit C
MKEFSNKYVFIFAAVMVIIVAALLSFFSMILQPKQYKNIEIEKKKSILSSLNIQVQTKEAEEIYSKIILESFAINTAGEKIEGIDAFNINVKLELTKPLVNQQLPIFVAKDSSNNNIYILPVHGKGLWGPIYGYVALQSDMNTIYGVSFDNDKETPGLGAEINQHWFEIRFKDKKIFNQTGDFVAIKVLKSGATGNPDNSVDGISGGTITSQGLENMLYNCLKSYQRFFIKNKTTNQTELAN